MKTDFTLKEFLGEEWESSQTELAGLAKTNQAEVHWAVKVLSFLGAWLAALLLMLFLALTGLLESEGVMLGLGVLLTAVAVWVGRVEKISPIAEPFFLSVGLIGQCLFVAGVILLLDGVQELPILLLIAALELVILIFSQSQLQRFVSVVAVVFCLYGIVIEIEIPQLIHFITGLLAAGLVYMWVFKEKLVYQVRWINGYFDAVAYSLAFSLIGVLAVSVNRDFYHEYFDPRWWWVTSGFIIFSLLFALYFALENFQLQNKKWLVLGLCLLILLPTLPAPGIAASLLFLVVGSYHGEKILVGVGVIAGVVFISYFYYNLQVSLLHKSFYLMGAGLLFFLFRIWVKKARS
ncbi:DUF4401 domain-containing protein [Flammeovirgaceae bacterium SG7u.111]|nr:DUF4401 domain-containing protein [Flammeovirgaceae bacterium SG7u.132]WPO35842.1 DUF4401 domain-containing protein [Flammeovirgaceae bacterium SG7u.111]